MTSWNCGSTSASLLMSENTTPPHLPLPCERQQYCAGNNPDFYESVWHFSQISFLPVNDSWYPSYHRHQMYGVDTSVWVRPPQETRRWIEMYQRQINTPNSLPSFIPPSLQQMLQLSPRAMWFHFCLFALRFPSLSWVDAETPRETAC